MSLSTARRSTPPQLLCSGTLEMRQRRSSDPALDLCTDDACSSGWAPPAKVEGEGAQSTARTPRAANPRRVVEGAGAHGLNGRGE